MPSRWRLPAPATASTSIGAISLPNWNDTPSGRYGPHIITNRLRQLLSQPYLAIVGTTRRDGSTQINPLWYDHVEERFRFNTSDPKHDWVRHLRRDNRATLFVIDPADQYRWAQIQCRFADITTSGGAEHVETLAHRYTGAPYRWPRGAEERWIVSLVAYRIVGRDGRAGWDA